MITPIRLHLGLPRNETGLKNLTISRKYFLKTLCFDRKYNIY